MMYKSRNFTVMISKSIYRLWILLLVILTVPFAIEILMGRISLLGVMLVVIFVYVPIVLLVLWSRLYQIRVNGSKISVLKRCGLVNFTIDLSEIVSIKWIRVTSKFGQNDNIKIFTTNKKSFKVETIMINSNKFIDMINQNVSEDKIQKIYKQK